MIRKVYYFLILILLLGSGCARYKNIAYIQDRYETPDSSNYHISVAEGGDLVLRVDDNIYINLYGLDIVQLESFNKEGGSSSGFTELALYLKGYIINLDGDVELPILGKIKLAGLTLAQAKDLLQERINEYFVGAVVDIRLLSYNVTILGEVKRPGKFQFLRREINILDALAQAGDLNGFGDARNIILIREVDGKSETYNFNLTSTDFFNSPYFWLKPNDVLYVKPLKSKMVSLNAPTLTLFFTSITTLLVILTYINS